MRIAVVGTGYVGLVTATGLAGSGHDVTCVDSDRGRVDSTNRGVPPFYEPGLGELLASALRDGRLRATSDLDEAVSGAEVTFIAVGTPSKDGDIDLTALCAATEAIGHSLSRSDSWRLVVVKSTVVPGTTDTLVRGILERASGRKAGSFGLCMNPEFLREGTAVEDFMKPDRIVIGQWDERSGKTLAEVYRSFDCPTLFTSLRNAEMTKYASNALLATLISFSNEMAALCEATPGTDVEEVIDALHLDRRLSTVVNGRRCAPGILTYLRAGCGFGGSCLPKDVLALRQFALKRGVAAPILDAVMAVNAARPASIVARTEEALGGLDGAAVAVLGLAFKPGSDDLRDSPALKIIELLFQKSAAVRAFDPCVSRLGEALSRYPVTLSPSPEALLEGADAAVLVTAWPEFQRLDWTTLCRRMRRPVIVDGRNMLRDVTLPPEAIYISTGRHHSMEEHESHEQAIHR
jgi:UDPglucose 6-dehydrogenase